MGRINYSYNYLLSLIANRPLYRYTDSVMDSTTVLSRMSSGRQNSRVEYSTNHLISQQSGVSESDIESRIADAPPIISNFTTTESAGNVIVSGDIDETSTVVISRGGTVIATLTNQTTSFTYTDTTVSPGTTYTYTAVATDASNNSSTTASSTITTSQTPSGYLDTLTADSTISGIASDGAPSTLSGLDSGVVYITGNFISRPGKVMFEAGGSGRGIIIYVKYYNTIPYLYAQCGDGSVSGGDVELVWEITSSFSTVIVSFCNAGENSGVNRLYVDDILRDTQNNGSELVIAGTNEGGTGNVYGDSYAVNRLGTVGEFTGETITTTKIYKNMTLDPDDF